MYSTMLQLALKVAPPAVAVLSALSGLGFGAMVVQGRNFIHFEKYSTDAQKSELFISSLVFNACGCFNIFAILACLGFVPARRERRRVARQLRTFDVREAEAWSAADKLFVLEKVRSWYGDSEEALASFNHFVRTEVATRLGWMQWRHEAVMVFVIWCITVVLFWCGLLINFSIFFTGTIKPLGWPTIQVDLATWAVPDHCLLANPWSHQGHCNTTMGAGHHNWVRDAPCFNGRLVDAPAQVPEGCVPSFFPSPILDTWNVSVTWYDTWYVSADAQQVGWIAYAAMLCYTLAVWCSTKWWARPETRPYAKEEGPKGTTVETTAGAGNGAMVSRQWTSESIAQRADGGVERPSHPLTADAQAEAEASASAPAAAASNLEA